MEKYTVDITDDALKDMEALYEYIAIKLQAPENAMEQYNRIADAILTLNYLPIRQSNMYSVIHMHIKCKRLPGVSI